MSTSVIKMTPNEIQKLASHYQTYFLNKKVPYTSFVAKKDGLTITAYTSGKVMFQGAQAESEASKWQTGVNNSSKQTSQKSGTLPANFAEKSIIGSDEVGNGSYFGPLIVCAVYGESSVLPTLKKLGVKDSKMLTDPQIRQLAPQIKEVVDYRLLTITPEKYNQIQPQYNAVRMKVALHNQAIALLLKDIAPKTPEGILIDQFTPEANYRKHLRSEKQQVTDNLYFITKAEQYHLAVAAASILCRAQFLEELEKASQEVGITLPSGAGAKSDQVAAKILQRGGVQLLGKYAKLHFANTEKAKKIAKKQ